MQGDFSVSILASGSRQIAVCALRILRRFYEPNQIMAARDISGSGAARRRLGVWFYAKHEQS